MTSPNENNSDTPFFVGYLKIPADLKRFLITASLALLAGFLGMGVLLGATQDDPGAAGFRFDYGRQTVTGVVESTPYPLMRVTQGNEHIKAGHTLMITGQGKNGVMARVRALEGQLATASGILLERGELDMLQLRGGKNGLAAAEGEGTAPTLETEALGRWKMAGEICDGKCLAGAMNPGRGLAHKACANLCIIGGIPPVFVSSKPVAGTEYFMVADSQGQELPKGAYSLVGQFISLEAELEKRGDMVVMKIDLDTVEVLP